MHTRDVGVRLLGEPHRGHPDLQFLGASQPGPDPFRLWTGPAGPDSQFEGPHRRQSPATGARSGPLHELGRGYTQAGYGSGTKAPSLVITEFIRGLSTVGFVRFAGSPGGVASGQFPRGRRRSACKYSTVDYSAVRQSPGRRITQEVCPAIVSNTAALLVSPGGYLYTVVCSPSWHAVTMGSWW